LKLDPQAIAIRRTCVTFQALSRSKFCIILRIEEHYDIELEEQVFSVETIEISPSQRTCLKENLKVVVSCSMPETRR